MRPVGFFDSGLGGASVLREALHLLPNENYLYYGDDANAPYGDRSYTDIAFLTEKSVSAMADFGIKAVVIACNTATATCIDALRGIPFSHSKYRACHKARLQNRRQRPRAHAFNRCHGKPSAL